MAGFLKIDGRISREESVLDLSETTAPGNVAGVGKFYASSVDNKPHFIASGGTDYDLTVEAGYWSRSGITVRPSNAGDYLALGDGAISTAGHALHVDGGATEADSTIALYRHYTTGAGSVLAFYSSGGSVGSPTAVGAAHKAGRIDFGGYDGDSYEVAARIRGEATELWSNSQRGIELNFYTVASGATSLTKRMTISDDGYVGIGTDVPLYGLTVESEDTTASSIAAFRYNAGGGSIFRAYSARGTQASPTTKLDGDTLGNCVFGGYDGNSWEQGSYLNGFTDGDWTDSNHGSGLKFYTVPNGSTTLTERVQIKSDGDVVLSSGNLQLGSGTSTTNGCVRWSGSDVEGRIGGAWVSLSGGGTRVDNTDVDSPSEIIDSFADTVCTAAYWHYVVSKGSNYRSGLINACWNAATNQVKSRNISTEDLGDTMDVVMSVDISSDTVRLIATVASNDWSIRTKRFFVDD